VCVCIVCINCNSASVGGVSFSTIDTQIQNVMIVSALMLSLTIGTYASIAREDWDAASNSGRFVDFLGVAIGLPALSVGKLIAVFQDLH
jgi:hypothetical protein